MTSTESIIRRIEVGAGCIVGAIGYAICDATHNCMDGHWAHGQYAEVLPWVVDGVWLFAFLTVAVVGIRGGFAWSRATAVAAGLIVAISFLLLPPGSLSFLATIPFLLVGALHLLFALRDSHRAAGTVSTASTDIQNAE